MPDPLPNDPSSLPTASLEHLAGLGGVALGALLRADQSRCWQRGERPRVEDYLRRLPGLANDHEALLDLLVSEALLREEQGEALNLDEYVRRFPALRPALERFFVGQQAVAGSLLSHPPSNGTSATAERPTLPPVVAPPEESIAVGSAPGNDTEDSAAGTAERGHRDIPGYALLGELGRGGMGVVYKARHNALNRVVALKMILSGEHAGEDELARFRREAEAVARLQHLHIVQIYEVGEHDGRAYFSLEFCPGGSLERKLGGTPLPAQEAAALVEQLARAMHAAHEKGVVHRDLKPANVLLAEDGTPKITDFGLAKKLDEAGQTASGAVMGTPSYMAPEQAGGKSEVIGPAADVYALGAILYECLAGRPPFKAATSLDTILQVISDEPVPPTQLQSKTPPDLETICLKCLRKEAAQRYGSALELAEDLRRFQAGEAIRARPVGRAERVWKWVRRNRAVAALLTGVALSLVLGAVVASVFALRASERAEAARKSEEGARTSARLLRRHLYIAKMKLAEGAWNDSSIPRLLELLQETQEVPSGEEDLRGFEWHYLWRCAHLDLLTLKGHTDQVTSVCFSPDGQRLASASADKTVKVWDVQTGRETLSLQGHTLGVSCVCFSPDGKRLASASSRLDAQKGALSGEIKVWDAQTGQETLSLKKHTSTVLSVCFSPDCRRLASAGDSTVKVWDAQTGQETLSLGHASGVISVSFSADGRRLASASADKTVKVWDAQTGQDTLTLMGHTGTVRSVSFSPDSRRLASASDDGTVKVWNAETGQQALSFKGHTSEVNSVCFSPDGKRLATTGLGDQTVKVWDVQTGQETFTLKGHTGFVYGVCWSLDGQRLASAGDQTVRVWDSQTSREGLFHMGHTSSVTSVCFSPDGHRLASAGVDKTVKVWDVQTGRETLSLHGHTSGISCVCFSPDGRRLASASDDQTVKMWDMQTGQETLSLRHTGPVKSVSFSPDGKRLASASTSVDLQRMIFLSSEVKVWDAETGQGVLTLTGHSKPVFGVCFSPDGKRLASACADQGLRMWDAQTGQETFSVQGLSNPVFTVCFSPDSRRLASASGDGTVKVWDAQTGQEVLTLKGHLNGVHNVCFSPDGRRLVSAGMDKTVKVWDAQTGLETLSLKGHTNSVLSVCFSPDGQQLASAGVDGTVKMWDARSIPNAPAWEAPRP